MNETLHQTGARHNLAPIISLCMMVKDEEAMLPRCLASAKEYVDEIVVVDTGSKDRTVEIAERFGAVVHHHPWEDDFSKHRNQSIAHASGEWFLILDADEEIVAGTGPLIREAARKAEVDSIAFEVISLFAGDKKGMQTQERLFKAGRGIHYEGRIHNRIVGVESVGYCPVRILHHGYNLPEEKGRRKHERRLRILEKELRETPRDPSLHHYLAASYLSVPDYEKASGAALEAIELAEGPGRESLPLLAWTYFIAAQSLFRLGRLEDSRDICLRGIEKFPHDLDLQFTACETAFHAQEAGQIAFHASRYMALHRALSENPVRRGLVHCVTYNQAWRVWWFRAMDHHSRGDGDAHRRFLKKALDTAPNPSEVYHALGRHFMERGRTAEAEAAFKQALEANPTGEEIILSLVELALKQGEEEQEIHWWRTLLIQKPEKAEKMRAEAARALERRQLDTARKFLTVLTDVYPQDVPVLRLTARHARMRGDIKEEARCLERIVQATGHGYSDRIALGMLLCRRGEIVKAARTFEALLLMDPENPAAHIGLSIAHWRRGRPEDCVSELDRALAILEAPLDMEIESLATLGALFALAGKLLLARGEAEAASSAYETALEMNCRIPEVYQGAATAGQQAGDPDLALKHLKAALEITQESGPVLRQMGDLYASLGRSEAAEFCYRKAAP